jgi:hypothetical protein
MLYFCTICCQAMDSLPPELTQTIASRLEVRTYQALRLTCKHAATTLTKVPILRYKAYTRSKSYIPSSRVRLHPDDICDSALLFMAARSYELGYAICHPRITNKGREDAFNRSYNKCDEETMLELLPHLQPSVRLHSDVFSLATERGIYSLLEFGLRLPVEIPAFKISVGIMSCAVRSEVYMLQILIDRGLVNADSAKHAIKEGLKFGNYAVVDMMMQHINDSLVP